MERNAYNDLDRDSTDHLTDQLCCCCSWLTVSIGAKRARL
jgi:hypothetical protein